MMWPGVGVTIEDCVVRRTEAVEMSDGDTNAECATGHSCPSGDVCSCRRCLQPSKVAACEAESGDQHVSAAVAGNDGFSTGSNLACYGRPSDVGRSESIAKDQSTPIRLGQWQSSLHALIASELEKCSREGSTKFYDDGGEVLPKSETKKDDQQPQQPVPTGVLRRRLHDRERHELHAIEHSYAEAFAALVSRESLERAQRGHGIDFFAWRARTALKSLSQFLDGLPEFRCLPAKVRSTLLRAAVPSCILLRAAQLFTPAKDCWMDENGLSFDVTNFFKAFPVSDPQLWIRYSRMARNFKLLLTPTADCSRGDGADGGDERVDIISYALLQAIVALSPEQGMLEAGDDEDLFASVSDAQVRYTLLLRHHLEAKHSFARAADLLPQLMQRLAEYKQFAVPFREAIHTSAVFRNDPVLAKALGP